MTPAFFLHALDANTGEPIEGFGGSVPIEGFPETGTVDLTGSKNSAVRFIVLHQGIIAVVGIHGVAGALATIVLEHVVLDQRRLGTTDYHSVLSRPLDDVVPDDDIEVGGPVSIVLETAETRLLCVHPAVQTQLRWPWCLRCKS